MNSVIQQNEQIIETAIEIFANLGVDVSINDIAKVADVDLSSYYYHFETYQDLIDKVYLYLKQDTLNAVVRGIENKNDIDDKLYIFWDNYIEWALNNKSKHKAFINLKRSNKISQNILDKAECMYSNIYQDVINSIDNKEIKEIPFPLFKDIIFSQLTTLFDYLNKENLCNCKVKEITELSYNIFLKGIKN